MSNGSNEKNPGTGGSFKVKLRQPADERVYLGSERSDPPGVVTQWLPHGEEITLEFVAGKWQEPSTWQCVGRVKEIFLGWETTTRLPRVHVRGESGDGRWSLEPVRGGGTNAWYLVYQFEQKKSYLCDPAKANDDSGHTHLADLAHAAVIELDPPQVG